MDVNGWFQRSRSWKKLSGRTDGNEDYQAGDIRRTVWKFVWKRIPFVGGAIDQTCNSQITDAISLARMGLENVDTSCSCLRQLGIPGDTGNVFDAIESASETIRSALEQLEKMSESLQQDKHHSGGKLLQMQMCVARKHQEWSTGQLSIRRNSIFFEAAGQSHWCIGPVAWENLQKLELLPDGDVSLKIKGDPGGYMLSGISRFEWLEELGSLTRADHSDELTNMDSFCSAFDDAETLTMWLADLGSPATRKPTLLSMSSAGNASVEGLPPTSNLVEGDEPLDHLPSLPSMASKSRFPVNDAPFTMTFVQAAAELPAAELPEKSKPVYFERLPNVNIEFVQNALSADSDWPPQLYLQQEIGAHHFNATPWSDGHQVSDTKVRRVRFQMPVPADVPKAVKSLVQLPPETAVTLLARLGSNDDVVVMLQEIVSHDVAYGNNFVCQEILHFRTHEDGGVIFEKYVEIRWVIALPWYARIVGTFVEMKAKGDGKTSAEFMARYLKEQASLVSG